MSKDRLVQEGSLSEAIDRMAALYGTAISVGLHGIGSAAGRSTAGQLVTIGTALHYGTRHIPPRPFLEYAMRVNRKKWVGLLADAARHKARDEERAFQMKVRRLGVVSVADVQAAIIDGPWAPNAPATIKRKGSARPLIDTGQLRQSIRAVIEGTGEVIG